MTNIESGKERSNITDNGQKEDQLKPKYVSPQLRNLSVENTEASAPGHNDFGGNPGDPGLS